MQRARYHLRDLLFARGKAVKVGELLCRQETIVRRSHDNGKSVDADNELLMRLYDRKRRIIDRVMRIEAALDVKS